MTTSIVILTHNQLPLTEKCLHSIRQHTSDYELIVVDNASTDDTVAYLNMQSDAIILENKENLGFAKGCNQGMALATGENILFLNNDTIVTKHWLENMLRVLYENERVGMVGPVTNYSSGHQCIPVTYSVMSDLSGLERFSRSHCQENAGCFTEVRRLVGFCLLAKRSMLDEIGGFDERYHLGNYEDDDLCLRALQAGYLLRVVQDSYIHHFGHATMHHLEDMNLASLMQQNRQKASEKWGNEIHQLIYKPARTVSFCMVVKNAEQTLAQSLVSILDEAEEIIVVDLGSDDRTIEIANNYASQVLRYTGPDEPQGPPRYAFNQATQEYVAWLQQDEVLDAEMIRKLASLKFSLDGSEDTVLLAKDRRLFRRAAGFRMPDEAEAGEGVSTMIAISLCMIVRNEEDGLANCLSSVKGIADEIVIVDIGSTDRTKEIAASFTDRIFDFEWTDDFSAARNYAFSLATKKYILWLDADNHLLEKDRQLFIKLKKSLGLDVDSVTMNDYLTFDTSGNVATSQRRHRIVRRDRGFQWIGAVHEYLAVSGNIQNSDVVITHHNRKMDTERNLQIYLKKEQAGEPFLPRDLYYFANELRDHKQYRKAILYYEKFLNGKQGWMEDNIQACMRIGDCFERLGQKDKQIASMSRSLAYDRPRPEFCCTLGGYFLENNHYENAIFWFTAAVNQERDKNTLALVTHFHSTWLPHLQLCICYDRLGQFDQAIAHNEKALSYYPNHPSMLFNRTYYQTKFGIDLEKKPE